MQRMFRNIGATTTFMNRNKKDNFQTSKKRLLHSDLLKWKISNILEKSASKARKISSN